MKWTEGFLARPTKSIHQHMEAGEVRQEKVSKSPPIQNTGGQDKNL